MEQLGILCQTKDEHITPCGLPGLAVVTLCLPSDGSQSTIHLTLWLTRLG